MASKFLTDIAQQAIGGIFGIGLGAYNDNRQYNQQERLQNLQIKGSKELTDYQMMKQLQMWKDTNYGAQMEELRKAGLNPGLLYGMGGAGGMTTGGGAAHTTGATATQGGGGEFGMAMQLTTLPEQKELLKAQARLANTEADKKAGIDTKVGEAQYNVLSQEFRNKIDEQVGINIENAIKQLDKFYQERTLEDRVKGVAYQTLRALNEADIAGNEAQIGDATIQAEITRIAAEGIGAGLKNAIMEQQLVNMRKEGKLTDAQVQKAYSDIQLNKETILNFTRTNMTEWAKMDEAAKNRAIQEQLMVHTTNEKPWNDAAIGSLRNVIDLIILKGLAPKGPTPIRGFGK